LPVTSNSFTGQPSIFAAGERTLRAAKGEQRLGQRRHDESEFKEPLPNCDREGDTPYSVLAVDDEASVRQLIRLLIDTDERFTLFGTAHDGRQALDRVEERCPDAIVCDIRMPGMNGLEALPT
jgi:PleD family two-component response regulator